MSVLGLILSFIGALGAIVAGGRYVQRRLAKARGRKLLKAAHRRYRFTRLRLSARVEPDLWRMIRECDLECTGGTLEDLQLGFRLGGDMEFVTRVRPDTYKIEPIGDPDGFHRYDVKFPAALEPGQTASFVVDTTGTIVGATPRPLWGWHSAYAVEHLVLRVVFADAPSGPVLHEVWDSTHRVLKQETLAADELTNEYSVTVSNPVPSLVYVVRW